MSNNTEIFDKFKMNIDKLNRILIYSDIITTREVEKTEKIYKKLKNIDYNSDKIERINKILGLKGDSIIQYTIADFDMVLNSTRKYVRNISELKPFLRNQVLIFAVSLYEFYLMDLIWNYHSTYLQFLKNSKKSITYKELYDYKELDEVYKQLMLKELDQVGRENYNEQLEYIKNALGLP